MKSIKILAVSLILLAAGATQAQTLANQVKISATASADISHARIIKLGAGSYIIDAAGVQRPAVFENAAVTSNEFFLRNYLMIGGGVYYNATAAAVHECVGSASVITWLNGAPQVITDGCAVSDLFKSYARR